MRETPTKKYRVIMMSILALAVVAGGLFIYRLATATPQCDCMFPNSKRYGVISAGGTCKEVKCELKQARQ